MQHFMVGSVQSLALWARGQLQLKAGFQYTCIFTQSRSSSKQDLRYFHGTERLGRLSDEGIGFEDTMKNLEAKLEAGILQVHSRHLLYQDPSSNNSR